MSMFCWILSLLDIAGLEFSDMTTVGSVLSLVDIAGLGLVCVM